MRVFFTDFDSGTPSSFSGVVTIQNVEGYIGFGTGDNDFSGNFLRNTTVGNPASKTTLTLSGLPSHTSIDLNFLLAIIDSWDGSKDTSSAPDVFNVTINGNSIFSETFTNFNVLRTYNPPPGVFLAFGSLGFNGGWPDSAYNMGLDPTFDSIPHTSSQLTVEWFASGGGWEGGDNESWAIDNVEVILNGVSGLPIVSIADATVTEGNSGTRNASFLVTLSAPSNQPVTLTYSTVNGTGSNGAVSPSDFTGANNQTLTIAPSNLAGTINIPINGDTNVEADETFFVSLLNVSNAVLSDTTAIGTITNDDNEPTVSV
ncbi:Calx-beta domain-containing protein, partial [Gloeocapsa sp. PCC 73106]|uniref:Calx-beta domain-containing protein n=1 Tax=Gloeocapsa sp. PCC 73106 TaxID=102232 RepID=UPI0002AC2386